MNFTTSVVLVFICTFSCTLAGIATSRLWPKALKNTLTGFCISPAVGLSIFIIISTIFGWLTGFKSALVIPTTLLLIGVSWHLAGRNRRIALHAALFSVFITFAILATVLKTGDLPYFQDAFTYIVHSQWLQNHAFHTPVEPNPLAPAYTQVAIYQGLDLRMGASFLLGWMQAASVSQWSTDVYPATVALLGSVGSLAVIGWISAIVPGKRRIAIAAGLATGCSIGGFGYGAIMGFFPQTCGLALSIGYFAALSRITLGCPDIRWYNFTPLALLLTTIGFSYSEILPFVLATTGLWFTVSLLSNLSNARKSLTQAIIFISLSLVIWNGEVFRMAHALIGQSKAVVGWSVPWTPQEFLAHGAGFQSGSGDGKFKMLPPIVSHIILILIFALALLNLFKINKNKIPIVRWTPALAFFALSAVAFSYFRWCTHSPWPTGTGQTWNQFKLSNWVSPSILVLSGATLASWSRHKITYFLSTLAFLIFAIGGTIGHYSLAKERMNEMFRQTGRQYNPLATYKDLRTVVVAGSHGRPVYLDLANASHKGRQMVAFFLHDQPVAADWSDDGYIYPWLTNTWMNYQISDCSLLVKMKDSISTINNNDFILGSLSVSRPPKFFATRGPIKGGYGIESDSSGWWTWCNRQVEIPFSIRSGIEETFSLTFEALPINTPRKLEINITGVNNISYSTTISMDQGWKKYSIGPLKADTSALTISLTSDGKPQVISASDQRTATFLIKNVRLSLDTATRQINQ